MSKNRNRPNSSRRRTSTAVILLFSFLFALGSIVGCGVKADPSAPDKSPFIGRGKPTYREAMKGLKPFEKKTDEEAEDEEPE